MGTLTPRDEYLRPMIDLTGVQYRLGFRVAEAEERIETEFETNQWESREAVKFAGAEAWRGCAMAGAWQLEDRQGIWRSVLLQYGQPWAARQSPSMGCGFCRPGWACASVCLALAGGGLSAACLLWDVLPGNDADCQVCLVQDSFCLQLVLAVHRAGGRLSLCGCGEGGQPPGAPEQSVRLCCIICDRHA